MLSIKIFTAIKKRGVLGFFGALVADFFVLSSNRLSLLRDQATRYRFLDRQTGSKELIIVLAGYKPYLWPATLSRLSKYRPDDADICIASSGMFSPKLAELCEEHDWSYLSTERNSPGVALNKAIKLHPSADFIYKLDEDIIIPFGFFDSLRSGYNLAWEDSLLEPGFVAPVLNINGITYKYFLEVLGLEKEYQDSFGSLLMRCDNLPVHNNSDAGWYIWERSLPFDYIAELFKNKSGYFSCSTRFSIGAILFRRSFIDDVGGFKSAWHSGVLGVDEDILCRDCTSQSRPMYIIKSVFAGHFSFYPQEKFMKEKLPVMSALDPITFPDDFYQ